MRACFFELIDDKVFLRYWFVAGRLYGSNELPGVPQTLCNLLARMADGCSLPDTRGNVCASEQQHTAIVDCRSYGVAPEFGAFCRAMDWTHQMSLPIMVEGQLRGFINFIRSKQKTFSKADAWLAESLSKQVALGFQMSKISEREIRDALEQRRDSVLAQVNNALRESLNTLEENHSEDHFLDRTLRQICSGVGAVGIWIFRARVHVTNFAAFAITMSHWPSQRAN